MPVPELQKLWEWYMETPHNFLFGNEKLRGLPVTMDEHSEPPLRPFPDRPHLRLLTDVLTEQDQVAVAKSRQLMVSWLCLALILYYAYHPGKRWGVVCKQFASADELLERMWGMHQRMPEGLVPVKVTRKQGLLSFLHPGAPSTVHAFSQDSDEARSKTYSGILVDEAAFAEKLDNLLTASKPTVMGGGKIWLVSTPNFVERFATVMSDNGRVTL